MPDSVIIVAGGSGSRFGGDVPKQFLHLRGLPLLMQTLGVFYAFDPGLELIVVLPADQLSYWEKLCREFGFNIPHKTTIGGKERFDSVKAGLDLMKPGGIAAIHDAVRPLVSRETLERCFSTARKLGNAIPVVQPVDSLRRVDKENSAIVPRQHYRLVQTPQCFRKTLILEGFKQPYDPEFTDDATVLEKAGQIIHLVEGNRENIKITTPGDMLIAEALFGLDHES